GDAAAAGQPGARAPAALAADDRSRAGGRGRPRDARPRARAPRRSGAGLRARGRPGAARLRGGDAMSEEVAKAAIEPWLAPIAGESPAGADARYDPLHEQVRAEAAKLDSPTGGVPDWPRLVKQARELTTTKSKDLLIESYAAYAMYNVEGLMGLASGVFLLAESMDRFW